MKRAVSFLLVISVFLVLSPAEAASSEPSVSAESAILFCADTGEIVFEKNAYEKRGIASTTKIMTSLLVLESGQNEKNVVAKKSDVSVEGTSIGLKSGDEISLITLVEGMLLESGNDAANVAARAVGGSTEKFVYLMNKRAKELGMSSTSFKNPSGLTAEGHYSTAYDMALLASQAIMNKEFKRICSLKSIRVSYGNPQYERTFYNHNKLLGSCKGVFGIKTGFTKASGRCLVSACERDGVTLVAVTLKAPNDWEDHKRLYDYGYGRVKAVERDSEKKVKIRVVGSEKESIYAQAQKCFTYKGFGISADFKEELFCERFLYSGIRKGDVVGFLRLSGFGGKVLSEVPLIAVEDAPSAFESSEKPLELIEKIERYFKGKFN